MADQFLSEKELIKETLENVDTNILRSYLKELTKEPHIAGHRRDNQLIDYIQKAWTDMGLDRVELAEYDFYLSWPNQVLNIVHKNTDLYFLKLYRSNNNNFNLR